MSKTESIIEHKTKCSIRNIESHSMVLDALVEDSEYNLYNVEVKEEDDGNHERKMRCNQTAVNRAYSNAANTEFGVLSQAVIVN